MTADGQPENPRCVATFRFAPSPNGLLHLGHAYSALLNLDLARAAGARMLLRIEDIDTVRCTPANEKMMLEDLEWIGFEWDEPPLRQSGRFDFYRDALDALAEEGLVYPARLSRGEIRARIRLWEEENGGNWPADPDGAPLYPGGERALPEQEREAMLRDGGEYALRLDMATAIRRAGRELSWREEGAGPDSEAGLVEARPDRWGDVVLGRKDVPASYHLSCVLDDAAQGVSHVVRGRDLFHATSVHRLLQELLGLPAPVYLHHDLVLGEDGRKLSKSRGDTALRSLRQAGMTRADIRRMVGLPAD